MSFNNAPIVYNGDYAKVLKRQLKLAESCYILSSTVDPSVTATDAPKGSILIKEDTGEIYQKQDAGSSTNWKLNTQLSLEYQAQFTKDPTGFVNRTDSTISYDDANRTITLTPTTSTVVFRQGVKFVILTPISATWTDTEGLWYAYIGSAGTIVTTQVMNGTIIAEEALIASWYWDATNNVSIIRSEERHGIQMDGATHSYLHSTFGTRYISGLALSGFTITSGPNTAPVAIAEAEFGSDSGVIADEDIHLNLDAIASTAAKNTFYRLGASGAWRRQADDSVPTVYTGGSRITYNQFTGGAWQLTEIGANNDFVLLHLFATNDAAQPVIAILGQAEYLTTNDARAGASTELNSIITAGLPIVEFRAIGTVIYQTNSGWNPAFKRCKVIEAVSGGADYVDWRTAQFAGNLAGVADHGLLSGLGDDDHIQYASLNGRAGNILKIDTINEFTAAAGVTLDGVLLKDSQVTTDVINEKTGAAGVTIDGVLLKDSQVTTDVINEKTGAAGVTVDGVLLKDNEVNTTAVKAKDANGIKFKENGDVEVGSVTDGGSWIFGRDSTTATTTGHQFFTADSNAIFFNNKKTTQSRIDVLFQVQDVTRGYLGSTTTNCFEFRNSSYTLIGSVTDAGAWANTAGGDWGTISDARLKKNVQSLTNSLDIIMSLRPVSYEWIDPTMNAKRPHVNFIAQEVEAVNPEWVVTGDSQTIDNNGETQVIENVKQVQLTASFMAHLVRSVQQLKEEIDQLKTQIGA